MNRLSRIRAKRAQLLARAAVQRERISVQLQAWKTPLALVDKSIAAVRYLRRHPQWIVATALLIAIMRPRRSLALARNGLVAWRAWRWIAESLRGLTTRTPA